MTTCIQRLREVSPAGRNDKKNSKGFTLLETLVALAILAIALAAVMRATSGSTGNADAMRKRVLADWVAQNRMAELTAFQQWQAIGKFSGREEQAGEWFSWEENIASTPNPLFQKVVIKVYGKDSRMLRQMTGYLMHPMS